MNDYTMPERRAAALLTIDAQRDYIAPSSPVKSVGCTPVLQPMKRLVQGMRAHDIPIFHLVRFYRPDGSNVDLCRRKAVEEGMRVLMPGTFGSELCEDLAPPDCPRLDPHLLLEGGVQQLGAKEAAVYKPRWGAFFGTPLELRLRNLGVTTLVVCGCNFATSGRATILEASERDFRVVLVPEAAAGLAKEAECELARVGIHLMTLQHCLDWIAGRKSWAGQAA